MASQKNITIAVGIVLVAALIGVTALLFSEKQTNQELLMEFELNKEELENEYTTFAKQYDELKLTVSNDSLSVLLEQEQLKTQRLLEELRTVKSSNASEIRRLKNELATLRKVMVGYINQIDSLNRLTEHQKQVIAAQLDASNISVLPANGRGKKAKRIKQLEKFVINFTIAKNITAQTGERTIYVLLTQPDNSVLTKNESNVFQYENRQLPYSIKKYIEYTGEEQDVTVYWDVEEFLHPGTYRVDIVAEDTFIGSHEFTLEK